MSGPHSDDNGNGDDNITDGDNTSASDDEIEADPAAPGPTRPGQQSRVEAARLATTSAAILAVAFTVLWGGYGGGGGGESGGGYADSGRRGSPPPPTSSEAPEAATVVGLATLLARWVTGASEAVARRTVASLASLVRALPLARSLHLHRFLGGVHAAALVLVAPAEGDLLDSYLRCFWGEAG